MNPNELNPLPQRDLRERGAAMVEYALLVALIAVVAIGALGILGRSVSDEYDDINETIEFELSQND